MEKSCENCYYKLSKITQRRIQDLQFLSKDSITNLCALKVEDKKICNHWSLGCEHCYNKEDDIFREEATFKYRGKLYCEKCCAKAVGIETREYTAYQFYDIFGDFLGNSNDMSLQDVLLNCSVVEYIGDDD